MATILLPGERVAGDAMLRGHGTYGKEGVVRASVAGSLERVDQLVSVRCVGGRYLGGVGDLVVGEVTEIGHKSWKVEIGSYRLATLTLSGVHLPNDQQRIRTRADALAMSELFDVGDVIVAEVQSVKADGATHLQTRANRYGRLANGELVKVRASLVRRLRAHFAALSLSKNVDLALGNNGYVWVQRKIPDAWINEFSTSSGGGSGEIDAKLSAEGWKAIRERHASSELTPTDFVKVRRAANAVRVLGMQGASVTPDTVEHVYDLSLALCQNPDDMLLRHHASALVQRMFDSEDAWHLGRSLVLDAMLQHNLSPGEEEEEEPMMDEEEDD